MCDAPSTSREHVPPKCIFPEKKDSPKGADFRKNLIKVPSCDRHNSHKSKDDEYVMFVLASAFRGNEHKSNHFASKVLRAFSRKPHVYSHFMAGLSPIMLKHPDGKIEHSASFKVDLERFNNALFQIACGLFYYQYKTKWQGGYQVLTNELMALDSPNAVRTNEVVQRVGERVSKAFEGQDRHGENDKIFTYSIISDQQNRHAIYMKFYEGIEITVLLTNV
ncbi:hypothetical protein EHN06_06820 [Marinobacter sp. NP-4(2019)]|nr:hypothetical protein EHN06_06820 [Marinobacter sp. NP-4(2019)]